MTLPTGRLSRPAYPGLPPKRTPGLRIGLFGGSFNPPHEGHRLATLVALRRLQLDRVWWLVSPGNPLKDTRNLPPLAARLASAAALADHPRIDVTGVESALGLRYTLDVLRALKQRCPGVEFVWLMGADNLRSFHLWQGWRTIADTVPIAVIDRPGSTHAAANSRAAWALEPWRLMEENARWLASCKPPAFTFIHGPRSDASSTALRQKRANPNPDDTDGRTE